MAINGFFTHYTIAIFSKVTKLDGLHTSLWETQEVPPTNAHTQKKTYQVDTNLLAQRLYLMEETSIMYALNLIEDALRWKQ